jgi:hypothetical protein
VERPRQYVMLELVRNARLIWTGVLEHAGLLAPGAARPESVDINGRLVRDTPRLTAALREVVADDARLHGLHEEIALLAAHSDQVLGRWAAVMLNADVYAEVVDRHVELASDISWLENLLDNSDPPEDQRRQRRARSSPAAQRRGPGDGVQAHRHCARPMAQDQRSRVRRARGAKFEKGVLVENQEAAA